MLRSSSSAFRVSSDAAAAAEEEAAMVSVEAASVERSDAQRGDLEAELRATLRLCAPELR